MFTICMTILTLRNFGVPIFLYAIAMFFDTILIAATLGIIFEGGR